MLKREELDKREYDILAPYAVKSAETKGRKHPEREHEYRSIYQRDKDRIIYSTAFRRLEYKTQVFVNHEGDYYRTRLTHTLEVAQIAKTIARALRLNEELVEAVALAHDIGHTPFGHAGEDALSEIMQDHGGFDHNSHGLRVVDLLEKRYPSFPGLNLTEEVRDGIMKHSTPFDHVRGVIPSEFIGSPALEIQVVNLSDEIAYDNHDLDDGLTSGLIEEEVLEGVSLWRKAHSEVRGKFPHADRETRKCQTVRELIDMQVTDLLIETEKNIKKFEIKKPSDVQKIPEGIISFSSSINALRKPLRDFLLKYLYKHYRVVRMSNKAHRFIRELFRVYAENPEQLPPGTQSKLENDDKYRVICDYIAGMTDRYALDEYNKFFEPYERV